MTVRVGVLFEYSSLNGGEHSMLSVLQALAPDKRYLFSAVAPSGGSLAAELLRWRIQHIPFSCRDADGNLRDVADTSVELIAIAQRLRLQIFHANSLSMSRLLGRLRKKVGCVCTGHLRDIMRLSQKAVSDLNQLHAIAAVSRATRTFHIAQGLSAANCSVVYNGVDTNQFRPLKNPTARREALPGVADDHCVLLNVGQICLRKGQLDLASSVVELLQRRSDIHLVLAGERHSEKAESIEYEAAIHRAFAEAGKSHHLHVLGRRNDVSRLMNAADVLVHTARQEPLGRVLLESGASGLPIIASDVGGTSEILRHIMDAVLVSPNNSKQLITAIEKLTDSPMLRIRLGDAARCRIEMHFGLDQAVVALDDFWMTALRTLHANASGQERS